MKYKKAEINALGEASTQIQDFTKSISSFGDPVNGSYTLLKPAYDLDE